MKSLLCSLLLTVCAVATIHADIQAPPSSDQGPTRKLGRGFSNVLSGITDFQQTIAIENDRDGNSAIPYGAIKARDASSPGWVRACSTSPPSRFR